MTVEQRTYCYTAKPILVGEFGRTAAHGERDKHELNPAVDPAVREQLWLGHRYRNELTAIGREFHAARAAIRASYVEARESEYRARKDVGEKSIKLPKVILSIKDQAKLQMVRQTLAAAQKAAYGASEAIWGTRGQINVSTSRALTDACKAKKTKGGYFPSGLPPRFARWDGSGLIAVQLQAGLSVPALHACSDTRVRIEGSDNRRILWLRIGSDGRAPIWTKFRLDWRRELPERGLVKWVRVLAKRRATHIYWEAQFIVEGEQLNLLPAPTKGAVGVDFGWRIREGGDVRVAVWADNAGEVGELLVPRGLVERWEKCEQLQSIRDKNFNDAVAALLLAREQRSTAWPNWLRQETRYAAQWQKYRSASRLARLVWLWRKEWAKSPGTAEDSELLSLLDTWRKQDKHLYEWEANRRHHVLETRKQLYISFARQLAQYTHVALEKLDLRDFAELPDEDEEPDSPIRVAARPRRFKVGLSILRAKLIDAVERAGGEYLLIEPMGTTMRCCACGAVNSFDAEKELRFRCESCGQTHDQDENAARNLLRAAQCGDGVLTRSNAQTRAAEAENQVAARAERVKKMVMAKRSKRAI